MDYITINYSLNQTYNVHRDVFQSIINKTLKQSTDIQIIGETKIDITNSGEDLELYLNINIKSKTNVGEVIKTFVNKLETKIMDMINSKPKNIQIILQGRFK